ncbi:MAG: signal peptidase II [Paludibacteraceae bacterium]|nr:signal peptidase II [Paludibacteraceae bacterium]
MSPKKQSIIVLTIILLALILDQTLKFYIKLNFTLGQAQSILPFFQLCFVENDGMAFGIEWFSKLLLTLFRIAAVALFSYYIYQLIFRQNARFIYIIFVALITAGALGNIIDCLFYGLIFSESTFNSVATLFPAGGGYAPLFYGKVVDMFYFPLIHNSAGETIFFRPVFNLADSFITISVFAILIFFSKDLNKSLSKNNNN